MSNYIKQINVDLISYPSPKRNDCLANFSWWMERRDIISIGRAQINFNDNLEVNINIVITRT